MCPLITFFCLAMPTLMPTYVTPPPRFFFGPSVYKIPLSLYKYQLEKYKFMIIFLNTDSVCKTYYEARSRAIIIENEMEITPASPPPPSTYLTIYKFLKNKCFSLTFSILNSSLIDIKNMTGLIEVTRSLLLSCESARAIIKMAKVMRLLVGINRSSIYHVTKS